MNAAHRLTTRALRAFLPWLVTGGAVTALVCLTGWPRTSTSGEVLGVTAGIAPLLATSSTRFRAGQHIDRSLSRRGIARVTNSVLGGGRRGIDVNVQGHRWTPRWLAVRAGHRYFVHQLPSYASSLSLAHVTIRKPAADGTRRWTLHFLPPPAA